VERYLLPGIVLIACGAGCGAVIEPGHRGLLFDPAGGGLQHEVLSPGYHRVGLSGRIEDFDVTYSTRAEALHVITREGLQLSVRMSVIYRPIIAELYELATEIGPAYYDEVVGPELRSAARGCIARRSFADLPGLNERLEDEVEHELRERIAGKHVEVSAVTFEAVELPPELASAIRERATAEQNARRKKIELESEALREKLEAEKAWEREKLELEHNVERRRLQRAAEGGR
jgi:regulator of protease activity HflC (stomatin/prohibitin superfamily)